MTANHAPGCPAIADPRDGCSCLLRAVAAQEGHLPECPCSRWPDLRGECLCSLLRACEARVREEFNQQALFVDAKAWGYRLGREDEREACIAAVSAPTLHDDACCSNGCTLMHSSEWEATRRIQIALGFPLSEEPPPPYRCDGSCNCTAAAFIAAIRAREEKP